jgi:FKBP-type peptidyl-prolyl cis-trans isomerase 2
MKNLCAVVMVLCSCLIGVSRIHAADAVVKDGSKVAFDYTMSVDGQVLDSSEGKKPLEYTHGEGKLIPGLSKNLAGMKVGEEKSFLVKPEDAYGQPNPQAYQEVPRASLPAEIKPEVGMFLEANDKEGRAFPVRVSEVKDNTVVMDFNHPLSGKTLAFKVKVTSIK